MRCDLYVRMVVKDRHVWAGRATTNTHSVNSLDKVGAHHSSLHG